MHDVGGVTLREKSIDKESREGRIGLVQVYTGDGKGKTTAALGLCLRAVGQGMKVKVLQFIKGGNYTGELKSTELFGDMFTIEQMGITGGFIMGKPTPDDIEAGKAGIRRAREVIAAGEHDMVVLDEINVAVKLGIVDVGEVIRIIDEKPKWMELVLTGRDAAEEVVGRADLVTEMCCRKHPYEKGIPARRGIEF